MEIKNTERYSTSLAVKGTKIKAISLYFIYAFTYFGVFERFPYVKLIERVILVPQPPESWDYSH
jgi:hypothetical protein